MNRRLATGLVLAVGLSALSNPLFAHHGMSGYDLSKTITLSGIISDFDWSNPHCLVHMDVKDAGGQIQHWTIELAGTYTMSHRDWTKDSLKPGDRVTVETHPAKNGTTLGISATTKYILKISANGKPLPVL